MEAPAQTIRVVQTTAQPNAASGTSSSTPMVVAVRKVGAGSDGVKMGYDSLVSAGWSRVNSDPIDSAQSFTEALKLRPGDVDASYGLGYALHRAGRTNEGLPHLCRARAGASAEVRAEIEGILGRSGRSCTP